MRVGKKDEGHSKKDKVRSEKDKNGSRIKDVLLCFAPPPLNIFVKENSMYNK